MKNTTKLTLVKNNKLLGYTLFSPESGDYVKLRYSHGKSLSFSFTKELLSAVCLNNHTDINILKNSVFPSYEIVPLYAERA